MLKEDFPCLHVTQDSGSLLDFTDEPSFIILEERLLRRVNGGDSPIIL